MKSNSEPQSPPTVSKRKRALPCVWMRFWHLDLYEQFFIGRQEFQKCGLFTAYPYKNWWTPDMSLDARPPRRLVAPWTRVKTTRLVRRERSAQETVDLLNRRPKKTLPPELLQEMGVTRPHTREELERTPLLALSVEQPNSDNGITGPTS